MDDLEDMGPVLLPEEAAKLAKAEKKRKKLQNVWINRKRLLAIFTSIFIVVIAVLVVMHVKNSLSNPLNGPGVNPASAVGKDTQISQTKTISGLQLSPYLNFGNKYASGILPVGDKMFVNDKPKKGYVFTCNAQFAPDSQAGAQLRGPWFIGTSRWDSNKKPTIAGAVDWSQQLAHKTENGKRIITSNDYPNHKTGVFPVTSKDTAHAYDANPNSILEQSLTYELSAGPSLTTPQCIKGEVGIMLTGVPLFDAFDASGRDAGAWEIEDGCDGHPQESGEYHYHTLSRCISDTSVHTVLGYALDGFPITGPKVAEKSILTTENLDECHGLVSEITQDGKKITTFHYVLTQDFPYSVSCFRGTPIDPPKPSTPGRKP